MKLFHIFIVACVVLAAAQAAAAALALLIVVAVIYGLFAHPGPTLGLLCLCILTGLAERQPYVLLGLVSIFAVTALLRKR